MRRCWAGFIGGNHYPGNIAWMGEHGLAEEISVHLQQSGVVREPVEILDVLNSPVRLGRQADPAEVVLVCRYSGKRGPIDDAVHQVSAGGQPAAIGQRLEHLSPYIEYVVGREQAFEEEVAVYGGTCP